MAAKKSKPIVTIRKVKSVSWELPEIAGNRKEELLGLGFEEGPYLNISGMPFLRVQLFLSVQYGCFAILHDDAQFVWVDLISGGKKPDTFHAVTSATGPLIGLVAQRPTYFASLQYSNLKADALHAEFLATRPKGPWVEPTLENFAGIYERVVKADGAWQAEHLEKAEDADEVMGRIVHAANVRAGKLKMADPREKLRQLLKRLELTKEMRRKIPGSLTSAVMDGNLEAARKFLESGRSIEEKTGMRSPLCAASGAGQLEMVDFLLERGAKASMPDDFLGGPIGSAALHGHADVVKRLLPLACAKEKEIALRHAESRGHGEIIQLLGGTPKASGKKGKSSKELGDSLKESFGSLELLTGNDDSVEPAIGAEREKVITEVLKLMRSRDLKGCFAKSDSEEDWLSYLVVETGEMRLVEAMLKHEVPAEQVSSALTTAAGQGNKAMCETLLKAGADPKHKGHIGWTALISAVKFGDPEIVKLLLDAGADPKARTEGGESPKTSVVGPWFKEIGEMLEAAVASRAKGKGKAKTAKQETCIKYEKAKKAKPLSERTGVKEFPRGNYNWEWALGFVKSDPASVARALSEFRSSWEWKPDCANQVIPGAGNCCLVFRLAGSEWSIVVRTLGWLGMREITELPEDAAAVSKKLGVPFVSYMSEDTSGYEGYEVYEKGKKVEEAGQGDVDVFKSSIRKQKPKFGDTFPDPVFSEMGIFVPEAYLDSDGYETKLLFRNVPADSVERLDYFAIGEGDD